MTEVSIVLPCFNAGATLAETLDSLRAQTDPRWEAICVDDGSSDDTCEILQRYAQQDSRIRPRRHGGKGPSAARNAGAGAARAPILAFCDADDLWHAEKTARLLQLFADPRVDVAFGQVGFFRGDIGSVKRRSQVPPGPLRAQSFLAENPLCTMSNVALRREAFRASGGFDPALRHNEDLEWLIRLAAKGCRIVGDPRLHVYYRTDAASLSADLRKMQAGRRVALATAARFGIRPSREDDAVFARYLARRALRRDGGAWAAFGYALAGLWRSPRAFLSPLRRGGPTAVAALVAPALPRPLRRALFSA